MSGLTLRNVTKTFGTTKAVDGLSLEIGEKEFVSVLGPSGCGKTTLLRMLAGLEQPDSGEILIGKKIVNDLPPSRRDIAMVFQTYALYPHMTVAGNIEYPLRKRGLSKAARQEKLKEAADLLQLGELMRRKPRELSGGQQQRVALGRAMVRDPEIFLLDEPLSNLDAKLRAHMRAELIRLQRRIGRTMVYVTHDQLEAMTMSDRIAIIRNGRLQQFASPQEVYDRPANEFVAGFIGTPSMNFIDGQLTPNGHFEYAGLRLDLGSLALHPRSGGTAKDTSVRLGIRPEALLFDERGQAARVSVIEPIGHELIVMLDYFGVEITARVPPSCQWAVDDEVKVRPAIDQIHVFDPADGRRLNKDTVTHGTRYG
jgi:multiple sugar transport system ATP-binding protein